MYGRFIEYLCSTEYGRKLVQGTAGALWTLEKGEALSPYGFTGQTVAISGASAQSAAITATQVDVTADTACFIALGNNPTAALNTSYRIPAGVGPIRLGLTSGDKIAVIGTAGNLWIHPVGEL